MLRINPFHPKTSLKSPYPTHHNPCIQPQLSNLNVQATAAAAAAPTDDDLGQQKSSQTTLYQILGIHTNASQAEIKTAYRRLAKMYHPDIDSSNPNAADFIKLHNAYAILSDPVHRARYDFSVSAKTAHSHFGYSASYTTNTTFKSTRRWETDQCW